MARKREERQQQEPRRGRRPGQGSFQARRRNCRFCRDGVAEVDYKDFGQLHHFVSERGKIRSRRTTGTCRRHQSQVAVAVKRAREMALLKYVGD